MKIKNTKITAYLIGILMLGLGSCQTTPPAAKLNMDHLNVWVDNPTEAKDKLVEIGFTAVPDSLSNVHVGQGTSGRYFYFLNSYLEFIFIYDENEFANNVKANPALDFKERAESPTNEYLPFGVAINMEEYDPTKLPFETVAYYQEWMGAYDRIYTAKNSKLNPSEPTVFTMFPEIKYDVFDSVDDLMNIPEEYAIWREFHKHKNGAQKITNVKIRTTKIDPASETANMINGLENVELVVGKECLMEIYFDQHKQGKVFDLRPEVPLKIYL
ncbi:MAG: hypothetical protein AB8G22_22660 [Saprospiraceae bacterium]